MIRLSPVLHVLLLAALAACASAQAPPEGFPAPTREPVPATEGAVPPAPAAPPSEAGVPSPHVTFAVLGNCRPGAAYAYSPVLPRLVQDLAAQPVELVLGTGNYVEGAQDPAVLQRQYQWLFWALHPLQAVRQIPVAFAAGEREIQSSTTLERTFAQYFGSRYYSFNRGAAHFIVLNTEIPGQEGRIEGDQWWWLVQDLYQALGSRYLFVVMHRPLFPVAAGRGRSLDRYPPYRDALHRLFAAYRVSGVFAGAEGLYHYQERDGVRYFITGGAGGPLETYASQGLLQHHYLLVSCGEQEFRAEVRPITP